VYPSLGDTAKQTLLIGIVLAAVAFGAFFVFYIARVFLLIFAAALIAVFLHGCGRWISTHLKLPQAAAVALVLLALLAFFGLSGWFIAPRVQAQLSTLQMSIPETIHKLSGGGQGSFNKLLGGAAGGLSNAAKLSSRVSDWAVDVVVVGFLSVYLAFQPTLYRKGVMALIPPRRRDAVGSALDRLERTLWRWFIGRIVGMVAIGLLVWVAMWAVGTPLPFALGLIAGVFEFVPYLGAFVSAIPAILMAAGESMTLAWIVIVLYVIVHGIDGYIIIPLVERRAVRIAPGLTIVVQVAMFLTAGILGVFVADPLTASILVLLERYYIEEPAQS
jgi:predicted PurR-regulated permease PerM